MGLNSELSGLMIKTNDWLMYRGKIKYNEYDWSFKQ